ncbi:MAG: YccF domain-containing protein [Bacteroidaceae bacterium]|nr:YccF domain-containing protein [Bacteroidaceae bacterium]
MKFLGNLIWLIFGGLECAIGYFAGSIALMITIIGIPLGVQTMKLGLLCLWPFGSTVSESANNIGCLSISMNIIWLVFGGLPTCVAHLLFGLLLCISIIGIPFGMQHFKMAKLALMPFGREITVAI